MFEPVELLKGLAVQTAIAGEFGVIHGGAELDDGEGEGGVLFDGFHGAWFVGAWLQ